MHLTNKFTKINAGNREKMQTKIGLVPFFRRRPVIRELGDACPPLAFDGRDYSPLNTGTPHREIEIQTPALSVILKLH